MRVDLANVGSRHRLRERGVLEELAPDAFSALGAEVHAIGTEPDGKNINTGFGATDLAALQQLVTRESLDLGVAFDGDGDRMLAVDERGEVVDGDQILAILALALGVDVVAVTVMTNLGFHRLMAENRVRVVTTPVGDRYVSEALAREGGLLGGEQSGHVIGWKPSDESCSSRPRSCSAEPSQAVR